jgi:ABC-2 type transport system ATP-binding protein/lipopolysaccharide transport system ATP-binding protein
MSTIIDLQNLSIHLPIQRTRLRRKMLAEGGAGGRVIKTKAGECVAALQNISLSINSGDRIALLGRNGAGKTTLLRTLAGVYLPSTGRAHIKGRIATLFSTTLSLSDFETGRQNIQVSGILRGIAQDRIQTLLPDILETTGLGEFIDLPLSKYSEGMKARLGFAMAILAEPDLLLIDEVLNAGDAVFLEAARKKITSLSGPDKSLIIASHSEELLGSICNKALWLDRGSLMGFGDYAATMTAFRDWCAGQA